MTTNDWVGTILTLVVFLLMVGVPTALHVLLVWVPTISSLFLSFTDWNGIRFSDMNWVGDSRTWHSSSNGQRFRGSGLTSYSG